MCGSSAKCLRFVTKAKDVSSAWPKNEISPNSNTTYVGVCRDELVLPKGSRSGTFQNNQLGTRGQKGVGRR